MKDIPQMRDDESINDWLHRLEIECPDIVQAAEMAARKTVLDIRKK